MESWRVWAGRDSEPEAGRGTAKWNSEHHSALSLVGDLGTGAHKGFLASKGG